MFQHLPSLPLIVAFLVAFVASASRIFTATRAFWGRFPAWFQTLAPQVALALGAVGTGLSGGVTSWTDLTVVFVGAGALLLPGIPSNRSAAPMQAGKPVTGTPSAGDVAVTAALNDGTAKPPSKFPPASKPPTFGGIGPMGGMLTLCLVLSASGCSIFGSGGSFWPKVEKCAPSPAHLLSQVTDILLAGGDYEKSLEELALADGADVVECAVKAAVDSLASKAGASPEDGSALARGKAFLAEHPVQ